MSRRFSRRSVLRAGAVLAVGAALGPAMPLLAREAESIPLVAGLNTHTWCGPDMAIAEATAGLPLRIAYGWDIGERRWLAYAPNTPIDSIGVLRHGQPLMLMMICAPAAFWTLVGPCSNQMSSQTLTPMRAPPIS